GLRADGANRRGFHPLEAFTGGADKLVCKTPGRARYSYPRSAPRTNAAARVSGLRLGRFAFGLVHDRLNFLFEPGIELKGPLQIGVRFLRLALIDPNDAAVDVGLGVFRLHGDHRAEIARRVLVFVQAQIGETAVERRLGVPGIEPNRVAEVARRLFVLLRLGAGDAAVVISVGQIPIALEGGAVIADRFVDFAERQVGVGAVVIVLRVVRLDADRLGEIFGRAVVASGVEMDAAAVDETARVVGIELDRGAVVVERKRVLFQAPVRVGAVVVSFGVFRI